MARLQKKSLSTPDEVRRFPLGKFEISLLDEAVFSHVVFEPGWHWQDHVQPIVGTITCQNRHVGVCVGGSLHVRPEEGADLVIVPGDVYEIPPGHDAWVDGDDSFESYEFTSGRVFALPPDEENRRLVTLLFTDIVDSTTQLERLGDRAWRELLLAHNERLRSTIDRFRGREVTTTGDGVLAVFDGAGRAVRCAKAIESSVADIGLSVRAGVHTGEVEFVGGNVRGLAVHMAARVMALAGPGEVAVSATTMQLAAGTDLRFEPMGQHELKGNSGTHEVFRLVGP
jgi:class 3 adenylate cyclase